MYQVLGGEPEMTGHLSNENVRIEPRVGAVSMHSYLSEPYQ